VLTSFSEDDFSKLGNSQSIQQTTNNWASSAVDAGAKALVCSPFEVSQLQSLGLKSIFITPGVRVEGDELSDQVRVMTPKDAISAGADFVVIGRSITGQWDGSDLKMRKKIELISNSLG
jgi:orotidine-5'-phosphate decarboxylase